MLSFDTAVIVLAVIALIAAFVNGALGYGFSSLTVPVSLVFYANRVLNPAVVVIEVFINLYVLLINLNGVRAVWKRVIPILIGLLPGIAVGASVLASLQPRHLHRYSASHSPSGSRLAEADPVDMAGWSSFWVSVGRPLFGNHPFRTPAGHVVQ